MMNNTIVGGVYDTQTGEYNENGIDESQGEGDTNYPLDPKYIGAPSGGGYTYGCAGSYYDPKKKEQIWVWTFLPNDCPDIDRLKALILEYYQLEGESKRLIQQVSNEITSSFDLNFKRDPALETKVFACWEEMAVVAWQIKDLGGIIPGSAENLLNTIKMVIGQADTKAGYPDARGNTNTTWCNRAAERILRLMGYDTSILYSRYERKGNIDYVYGHYDTRGVLSFGWTNANRMAQNAAEAARRGDIIEVTPEEAYYYANQGIPILAAMDKSMNPDPRHRIGHVGIVAPNNSPYNGEGNLLIGQAGGPNRNRIDLQSNSFTEGFEVHYYLLKKL